MITKMLLVWKGDNNLCTFPAVHTSQIKKILLLHHNFTIHLSTGGIKILSSALLRTTDNIKVKNMLVPGSYHM